jgi:hypothetical protein
MRSIAFCASVGVFVRPVCFPSVVERFRGLLALPLRVCRGAFPLTPSRMALFSPLLAFLPLGRVLGGVRGFRAFVSGFRGFRGCGVLSCCSVMLSRCARAVRAVLPLEGIPTRILRAGACGRCYLTLPNYRKKLSDIRVGQGVDS